MSELFRSQPDDESLFEVTSSSSETEAAQAVVIVEQFLNQCRHSNIESGDELAHFIVEALWKHSDDEWIRQLQDQMVTPDDATYETLKKEDEIYSRILALQDQAKAKAVRGEPMSIRRKALIQLLDLRAGQVAAIDDSSSEHVIKYWNEVIDRL